MKKQQIEKILLDCTQAQKITGTQSIQTLWSGYGEIVRYKLKGGSHPSIIVKHVQLDQRDSHPRGWNSDLSHERKLHSYEVETQWYKNWSSRLNDQCPIPHCLTVEEVQGDVVMVMEDLDAAGFPLRKSSVNSGELQACMTWLAQFHAAFMGAKPEGLWKQGTYWHLATRPDELKVLDDVELRRAALTIDRRLEDTPYLTIVHGDAKLANFCFSAKGEVAAVDFQYVGGGCGMKDLAYFLGSCLYEDEMEEREDELLNYYFLELRAALQKQGTSLNMDDLEQNWRDLYPYAWTDFHRFLKGWSPGHWKINSYSEKMQRRVLKQLEECL